METWKFLIVFAAVFSLVACSPPAEKITPLSETATLIPPSDTPGPTQIPSSPAFTPTPVPSQTPIPSPIPNTSLLTILNPQDGGTVQAVMETADALPMATLEMILKMETTSRVILEADGQLVRIREVPDYEMGDPVELNWTPWHGNGEYQLSVKVMDIKGELVHKKQLTYQVRGIPEGVPNVKDRFIRAYEDQFGLSLTEPAFMYHSLMYHTTQDRDLWVSTAYVGDTLYEGLLPHTGVMEWRKHVPIQTQDQNGYCSPEGTYQLLIVIVEYEGSRLNPDRVRTELIREAERANQRWAAEADLVGLQGPVLEIDVVVAGPVAPKTPGQVLNPEDVNALTEYNAFDFNLLVEVDLDPHRRTMNQYDPHAGGVHFGQPCKPVAGEGVNALMVVEDASDLQYLGRALYQHELLHLMGWEHHWASGDAEGRSEVYWGEMPLPALLFGWRDTDGDGVIEIQDPDPYGMHP